MEPRRQTQQHDSEREVSPGLPAANKNRFRKKPISLRLVSVVGVILTLAFGTIAWIYFGAGNSTTKGLVALSFAYREERPFESRISGFAYAPAITRRGGRAAVNEAARDQAERLLLEGLSESPSAASNHAAGKLYLAKHEFQKAINYFQLALAQSDRPEIRNDLGVAIFELSQQTATDEPKSNQILELLARSLENFDATLRLDDTNLDALYNRALILSHMKVPQQTKAAWTNYLASESQSQWKAEGLDRLQSELRLDGTRSTPSETLTAFLSASDAQDDERAWQILSANQEMITENYIPEELARAYLKEDPAADSAPSRMLKALRYAGSLTRSRVRDSFVSDLADYYSRSAPPRRAVLHTAHANLVAGFSSCLAAKYGDALTKFEPARKLFDQEHDEWEAAISDYWIAYCKSQQDGLRDSTTLLTNLAGYCDRKHYLWLRGQALGWLAANEVELSDHSKAIETANRALWIAERIDDSYNRQKILALLANEYIYLAQPGRALEYNWRTLDLVDLRFTGVRQIWRDYLYATRSLTALRFYGAAAVYANEMLTLALTSVNDPAVTHFSYLNLAQIYGGEQQFDKAIEAAGESLKLSQAIPDAAVSRKLSAGSLRIVGHLQRQAGRLPDALSSYDRAIQMYDQMELSLYTYDAHKGRLLCYAALNNTDKFDAELPVVLDQFERYRARIREEQNRNTFFDREQSVYDLAIAHAARKGDDFAALSYSERSRARSLLAALNSSNDQASAPMALPEIQAAIPADVQIVEYSVLSDKLIVWLITRNSFKHFTTIVSSDKLQKNVSAYVKDLSAGPGRPNVGSLSRGLFDLAIAPIASDLDPQKVICVIPDKALSYLAFATLQSSSGRYLISDFALMTSPSLRVFLHYTEIATRRAATNSEVLLSVGDPSFARTAHPDLKDLPAAADEAEAIAVNYSKSYKLIGPAAVKTAIEKRLPEIDVFHFAGHYVIDNLQPLQSRLVLATERRDGGAEANTDLTGNDLIGLKLPHARLAVLSGCQTGGEAYFNGEGLIGLSRMFLEAGAPLVIASQWAVDSEPTAQLMIKFHRYRKQLSSVQALRKAELEMLNDPNGRYRDPFYWAAFTPVGGYAIF